MAHAVSVSSGTARLSGAAEADAVRAQSDASRPLRLSVLGATGSIGASTLDLAARHPDRIEVVALTAQ